MTGTTAYAALIPDLVPAHQIGSASGWMGLMTMSGIYLSIYLFFMYLSIYFIYY